MTLDHFEDFLISERLLKPATARKRRALLQSMMKRGFDLEAFQASQDGADYEKRRIMADLQRRDDISNSGAGNYVRVLVGLAEWCGHDGFKVRYPRPEQPAPKAYSSEEFAALRRFRYPRQRLMEKQIRGLMEFAYFTGMRPGEIAQASMRDLDVEKSRVYVRHPEKGSWRRWVPVERELWAPTRAFGAWMRHVERLDTKQLWWRVVRGDLDGQPDANTFRAWMNTMVKPATQVDAAMHRFRHTRAVALHRAGLDVVYIKEYLGHAKLEATWTYLRSLVGHLEDAFGKIKMPGVAHAAV